MLLLKLFAIVTIDLIGISLYCLSIIIYIILKIDINGYINENRKKIVEYKTINNIYNV
jgi:hypothetical protein